MAFSCKLTLVLVIKKKRLNLLIGIKTRSVLHSSDKCMHKKWQIFGWIKKLSWHRLDLIYKKADQFSCEYLSKKESLENWNKILRSLNFHSKINLCAINSVFYETFDSKSIISWYFSMFLSSLFFHGWKMNMQQQHQK